MKRYPLLRILLLCLIFVSAVRAQESENPDPATGAAADAVPALELRIAEDSPAEGLTPASVPGDKKMIYLHKLAIVTNHDVIFARLAPEAREPTIEVEFTQASAARLHAVTSDNIGKYMAVLVDGKVIFAPKLQAEISNKAMITGIATKAEAQRIVRAISPQIFSASLLLLKPDWSKVPRAAEVKAQLRDVLRAVKVPQKHLDNLSESGTDILFPPEIISLYTPQHFHQFLAWLESNGLVEQTIPFSFPQQSKSGEGDGSDFFDGPGEGFAAAIQADASLSRPFEFLDLPALANTGSETFVTREAEFRWEVDFQPKDDGIMLSASRVLQIVERTRGQDVAVPKIELDRSYWRIQMPRGMVAVTSAFPVKSESQLLDAARRKGFVALLVVVPKIAIRNSFDVEARPELHLPDQVRILNSLHSPRHKFPEIVRTPPDLITEVYVLKYATAKSIASALKQLMGDDIKVFAEESRNSVIVQADEPNLAKVRTVIESLDSASPKPAATSMPPGNAETIRELRKNYKTNEQRAQTIAAELRRQISLNKPSEKLQAELRALVARSYELRRELHEAELAQTEHELQQARETLTQRERIKVQIIERRVKDLLNPALNWDIESGGSTPK